MTAAHVEVAEGVALLTLDDPDRRNALSPAMVEEIVAAMDRLEGDVDVGALIVTGSPPAFCAGADLSSLGKSEGGGLRSVYEGFLRIARSPLPTIAAVNGPAVGAGMNLALCCDVRIAARSARFDTRFLHIGLHPGGGHTWMLHRVTGPQTAAAMVLFGEVLDGAAAERVGLVWRCVDDGLLHDTAHQLASQAAGLPREVLRRAKETLQAVQNIYTHEGAVDVELEAQMWSLSQPAFAERLQAMRDRIGRH